jgi:diadenosine tetraphosphate (Ap4A) HIT family hydrolase
MALWSDPERWHRLREGLDCPICDRGRPRDVVAELETAYVTATEQACLFGYCCLVLKRHAVELHEMPEGEAGAFMLDLRELSRAVQEITGAVKLNWEIHGNTIPHLHAHLFPRYVGDRFERRPIDPREVEPSAYGPGRFDRFVADLRQQLGRA